MEKSTFPESKSKFDKLAELTQGKNANIEQEIINKIIEKFLHEYAQTNKKQSEVVKKLIEEYPDVDICKIIRPHVDLSRE